MDEIRTAEQQQTLTGAFASDDCADLLAAVGIGLWRWDGARDRLMLHASLVRLLGARGVETPVPLAAWARRFRIHGLPALRAQAAACLAGATEEIAGTVSLRDAAGARRTCRLEARARREPDPAAPPVLVGTVRFLPTAGRGPAGPRRPAARNALLESQLRRFQEEEFLLYSERLERLVRARTERILELERERAASERQAAIGRMAARIAHEINNPLGGIRNCAILLGRAVPPGHPQAPYAERMLREIDRVAAIIRQMYGLYRPEPSATGISRLEVVCAEVTESLAGEAAAAGLRLRASVPEEELRVRMRESDLRQVLFNLLRNAIEASPAGEEILLEADVCGPEVEIRVRDHGHGISEACRPHVFEPFFTTKTAGGPGGLGLGLAISRSLAASARGSLSFTSTSGGETCFRLRLRRAIEEE